MVFLKASVMRRVIMPRMRVLWQHGLGNVKQTEDLAEESLQMYSVYVREANRLSGVHGRRRSRLEMKLTWGQCLSSATMR